MLRALWGWLVPVGRALFAIGLIGLGIDHFIFRQFITGRPPAWSDAVPGGAVFAYVTGLLLILTGLAILSRRWARAAGIVAGALILLWAFPRHLPVLVGGTFLSGEWTRAGKALWLGAGCLTAAATFPPIHPGALFASLLNWNRELVLAGRVSLGLFQLLAGVQHFKFKRFVASLIPAWFPGDPVFWTGFAGVALIAGGIGLLIPGTARWAALLSGVMILSWVFLVHLPQELSGVGDRIAIFEAPAAAGILFVIAGSLLSTTARTATTA